MEEKSAVMDKKRAIRDKILHLKKIFAKQDNIGQGENEDVHEEAAQHSAGGRNTDKKKRKLVVDDDEHKETYSVRHKKDELETCPPKVYKGKDICIDRRNIFQQFPFQKKDFESLYHDIHGKAMYESVKSKMPGPPLFDEEGIRELLVDMQAKSRHINDDLKEVETAVYSYLFRMLGHKEDVFKSEVWEELTSEKS